MKIIVSRFIKSLLFLVLGAGFVYFYYQWYETESAQTQLVSKQQNTKSNKQDQPAQSEKQIAVEYFDANKWDNNTDLKKVYKGTYEIEGDNGKKAVWVKKESDILITVPQANDILVKGYIPFSLHKKADENIKEVKINVLVNKKVIGELTFTEDKSFEYTVKRSAFENDGKQVDIQLEVDHDYIPSKTGLSKDERSLAMLINYIGPNQTP